MSTEISNRRRTSITFTSWLIDGRADAPILDRLARYACIAVICCIIPLCAPIVFPWSLWSRWRFSRHQGLLRRRNDAMRSAHRLLSLDELAIRMDRGEGTLVLILWMQHLTEAPIGWSKNWNDVWWTPQKPWELDPPGSMQSDQLFAPMPEPDANGMVHCIRHIALPNEAPTTVYTLADEDSRRFVADILEHGVRAEIPNLKFIEPVRSTEPFGPEWRWYRARFPKVPILVLFR